MKKKLMFDSLLVFSFSCIHLTNFMLIIITRGVICLKLKCYTHL